MQTVYFRDYRTTGDDGYDLYRALSDLNGKTGVRLVFDKDIYEIAPDRCFERCLYISNHGWNGLKRIAALVENMNDLELEFNGSTIICKDVITPFAIINSESITVKNVVLENPNTYFYQARIVGHGDGYVDLEKMVGDERFFTRRGIELAAWYKQSMLVAHNSIEFDAVSGELSSGDHSFGAQMTQMRFEKTGENTLRLHGVKRYPPINNVVVISATRRLGCGFFCENSSDIYLENVTVHSCLGMGFLAQTCHNVTLNGFNTLRHGEQYYTACADATHFVNCTGTVLVENSTFEGQLDDALNIHGMYTSIFDKTANEIFVHEVHEEAKGIKIYRSGDKINIMPPDTLIPYTQKTIKDVEYINEDTVRLVLWESTDDINIGDDVDNADRAAELIFRNNTVRNNRARGMLIATSGKTVIENCYFHTSGCAIKFESNGEFWYESGGVEDVTIQNNVFDKCKYVPEQWGSSVIECAPRKAVEDGKYFHKEIKVINNKFDMLIDTVVSFDNIEHAVYSGNTVISDNGISPTVKLHHIGKADITDSIKTEG